MALNIVIFIYKWLHWSNMLNIISKLVSTENNVCNKHYNINKSRFFKPGVPGFLELLCLRMSLCMFVYVCVCPPPRLLITSGVMWCDIDPI